MKHSEAMAVILGSYCLYMLDNTLDHQEKRKGTTIKLRQKIRKGISPAKYLPYRGLSETVWEQTVNEVKGKGLKLTVFQFVEEMFFEHEIKFKELFGDDILNIAGSFSVKTGFAIDKKVIKDTEYIVKLLSKNSSKAIYEYHRLLEKFSDTTGSTDVSPNVKELNEMMARIKESFCRVECAAANCAKAAEEYKEAHKERVKYETNNNTRA